MSHNNLIIDTDVGCDDAAAIAFALIHPTTTVHAVTTVFGNVSRAQSMINVHSILQMFGYNSDTADPVETTEPHSKYIPIYAGADEAMDKIFISVWSGHGPTGTGDHKFEVDVSKAVKYYRKPSLFTQNGEECGEIIKKDQHVDPIKIAHEKPISLNARLIGYSPSALPSIVAPEEGVLAPVEHNGDHYTTPDTCPLSQLALECSEKGYIIPASIDSYHHSLKTTVTAAQALVQMVNTSPHFYDLVCLGPLTNVAQALLLDPAFLGKLKSFAWLGGSLGPGNITKYSEFNSYCDSLAAKMVFEALLLVQKANNSSGESGLKVVLVGWDAGVQSAFHIDEYKSIFHTSNFFQWPETPRDHTQTEAPHEKYIFPYIVRKFVSRYEAIVQEAVDMNHSTLKGLHHTHDIDMGVNVGHEKPEFLNEEDDHTDVTLNVVDMMAMCCVLCPEVIVETRMGMFNVVNNTSSEENGMIIDMATCDVEMSAKLLKNSKITDDLHKNVNTMYETAESTSDNSHESGETSGSTDSKMFPMQYVTKIDVTKYAEILRVFAHSTVRE